MAESAQSPTLPDREIGQLGPSGSTRTLSWGTKGACMSPGVKCGVTCLPRICSAQRSPLPYPETPQENVTCVGILRSPQPPEMEGIEQRLCFLAPATFKRTLEEFYSSKIHLKLIFYACAKDLNLRFPPFNSSSIGIR